MEVALLLPITARALHFWAIATLLGGAGFALLLRDVSPYARELLRAAAILAAVSGLAWFAATFIEMAGAWASLLDAATWEAFLAAPFGLPWAARLVLCGLAFCLALGGKPWPCLILGLAFVIDQAWLGHAAMAPGGQAAVQIASYWLHVLAGFAWTGALVMVCVLSLEARRIPPRGLALFSTIGTAVVAVLVLSGIANAGFRGATPASLMSDTYGQVLAIKLTLVAGMITLALVNRRRTHHVEANMTATLWLEMAVGLAVLLAASALGMTPPPGD